MAAVLLATACGKSSITCAEYIAWVEDTANGLCVTHRRGDMTYTAQYKPVSYVAMKELGRLPASRDELEKEAIPFEGLQYVTLRIRGKEGSGDVLKLNLKSTNEYYERISYLNALVQHDIRLLDGGDTLPCRISHFERTYGAAPYISLVLAFDAPEKKEAGDKVLLFTDRIYRGEDIALTIRKEALSYIPELKLNRLP